MELELEDEVCGGGGMPQRYSAIVPSYNPKYIEDGGCSESGEEVSSAISFLRRKAGCGLCVICSLCPMREVFGMRGLLEGVCREEASKRGIEGELDRARGCPSRPGEGG